jgi:hypothetical protein
MSEHTITVERVDTQETTIKVNAASPEDAFKQVKAGHGREVATVRKSQFVIRDYPDETMKKG